VKRAQWPRTLLAAGIVAAWVAAFQSVVPSAPRASPRQHDEVRIQALVTSRGSPVEGLTADDFDVRDAGVPLRVTLAAGKIPVRVAVVFDASGNAAGSRFESAQVVREFTRALGPGDTSAFLSFSQQVVLHGPPRAGLPDVAFAATALEAIRPTGRTAMRDAIFQGLTLAQADSVRPLLLLFSEGVDNASWLSEGAVLDAAMRLDVVVHAVVSAPSTNLPPGELQKGEAFLRRITDATGGQLDVAPAEQVGGHWARILEEFRTRYLLTCAPDPARRDGGWRELTVKLKGRAGTVRARSGYYAGKEGAR
jgi:VWFA-related protein